MTGTFIPFDGSNPEQLPPQFAGWSVLPPSRIGSDYSPEVAAGPLALGMRSSRLLLECETAIEEFFASEQSRLWIMDFESADDLRPLGELPAAIASRILCLPCHGWLLLKAGLDESTDRSGIHSVETFLEACLADAEPIPAMTGLQTTTGEAFSLPALAPDSIHPLKRERADRAENVDWTQIFGSVSSRDDLAALRAGLLQLFDLLDRSHEYSQSVEGRGRNRAGDYWHAIMHRREPDFSNAKYWFRRVGSHPLYEEMADWAAESLAHGEPIPKELFADGWDPFAFVDFCRDATAEGSEANRIAREIQWREMLGLLKHTVADAFG